MERIDEVERRCWWLGSAGRDPKIQANIRGLKLFNLDKNISIDINIFKVLQICFCSKRRTKLTSLNFNVSIVIDILYITSTIFYTLLR